MMATARASGIVPIAVAFTMTAVLSGSSSAGIVRGTVHVPSMPQEAPAPNAYPGRASSLPHANMMMHGAPGDAVIWLERVPASADTARAGPHPKLAQKDQCFQPRVLPVTIGTTVDFPNLDPIYHNVFSASPIKRFDLGKYPRGHSKSVTFDRPGLVNVYCDIHSHMEAFVLVLKTHVFTQPDGSGAYALPPVPPGTYALHLWHPDLREIQREVTVPADGDATVDIGW
jgi:plastocyanin